MSVSNKAILALIDTLETRKQIMHKALEGEISAITSTPTDKLIADKYIALYDTLTEQFQDDLITLMKTKE